MEDKILEFTYRPTAKKQKVFPLFFTLLAVSGALVILSTQLPKYKGVVSLVAVIGLCVCVYLFTRYFLSEYVYSVNINSDGDAVFVVSRVTGKRSSTMCAVRLADFTEIKKLTKETKRQHTPRPDAIKYNFSPEYRPETVYVILTQSRYQKCEITITGTDELTSRLMEYAGYAKGADELSEY